MEEQYLLQPLLPTTTAAFVPASVDHPPLPSNNGGGNGDTDVMPSNSSIIFRLLFVFLVGLVSIWANREASKGFKLTVVNDAAHSAAGRRFSHTYISDDRATREVLKASDFVENLLYHNNIDGDRTTAEKKQVKHVLLRLASQNLSSTVTVEAGKDHSFVINLCPSIMEARDAKYAVTSAVRRGMARLWLWDGGTRAPPALINGIVEYIGMLVGLTVGEPSHPYGSPEVFQESVRSNNNCWEEEDPKLVAHFLNYCEKKSEGLFIQRLNQAMKDEWREGMADDALGMPAQKLCTSFKSSYGTFAHLH